MIVVYRGKHCPYCSRYLQELDPLLPRLNAIGVDAIAVSADSLDRAEPHIAKLGIRLAIGYDLSIAQMRSLTVPKLGAIGHQEADVVGRQIAKDVGAMPAAEADVGWMPEVVCIGDMGGGKAFYIHATSWFGGDIQELRMGHLPYAQKMAYKEMFFRNHGKVPNWGVPLASWTAEHIKI